MLQTLEEIHVRPKTGMQSKAPFLIGPNLMDSMYFMLLLITIKITNAQEDAAAWVFSLSLSLCFFSISPPAYFVAIPLLWKEKEGDNGEGKSGPVGCGRIMWSRMLSRDFLPQNKCEVM